MIALLGCAEDREAVKDALSGWDAEKFESEASAAGCVVAMFRDHETWMRHAQARALAALPVFTIERIGDAAPRALGPCARPLSGLRLLDLTRVIAGPVCGRTLAAHGADVLRIASPALPSIEWLVIDSGRGKRSAFVDLETADGRAALARLLERADVFVQGYRPGAIARHGFGPEDVSRIRPGIVYVSLSAYGHVGPWSGKRGFDSLVQTATGFNHDEGRAAGIDGPKELPAQALDHASGQLMAFGALMARLRQAREGGSWHVRVSLAQTGGWIRGLGRVEGGLGARDLALEDVADRIDESDSAFGRLRAVRHAAELSETPARYALPAAKLGTHEPKWEDE